MLIVGDAVSNCDRANDQSVVVSYQREIQISESWSVDNTIGISFSGLHLPTSRGWSSSATQRAGQAITISIPPGRVVCILLFSIKTNVYLLFFFLFSGCINNRRQLQEHKRDYAC